MEPRPAWLDKPPKPDAGSPWREGGRDYVFLHVSVPCPKELIEGLPDAEDDLEAVPLWADLFSDFMEACSRFGRWLWRLSVLATALGGIVMVVLELARPDWGTPASLARTALFVAVTVCGWGTFNTFGAAKWSRSFDDLAWTRNVLHWVNVGLNMRQDEVVRWSQAVRLSPDPRPTDEDLGP